AGFNVVVSSRSYVPVIDDPDIQPIMLRAQEMSRYVEDGVLDCGITGNDWILENRSDVVKLADLAYAKQSMNPGRWVLAIQEQSSITSVKDLKGKRIATELVEVTKEYLKKNNVEADVEFSWGATEVKVAARLVDAIVELTETGSSLRAHNLKEIATICTSTTQFIANKKAAKDPAKRKKMDQIIMLLRGAIDAEGKVGLKMNIPAKNLSRLLKVLPALRQPTISHLSDEKWVAVETVIEEKLVRKIIPELKEAGAEGIIEYSLNKLIS
ncbi:MAG: ATP phosphoribosyltransferase, partial [Candidatus Omnitrophica bacterium]|nr:ATP phosphoribosyltransferase [Candidatus Omnitrophota bacterium]